MKITTKACLTIVSLGTLAAVGAPAIAHAEPLNGTIYCDPEMDASGNAATVCTSVSGGGGSDTGGENGAPPPRTGVGYTIPNVGGTAIYRLVNPQSGDHLLTQSYGEAVSADNYSGYGYEGLIGSFAANGASGSVPVYRAWNGSDHFYTASWNELVQACAHGYRYEEIAGYIFPSPVASSCALYRVRIGTHHFYTASPTEFGKALQNGGVYEGVTGFILPYGGTCPS